MVDEKLSWDQLTLYEEALSEQEVKDAEDAGRKPRGKYLVEVVDSFPREAKGDNYTFFMANLKFKILEVLQLFDITDEEIFEREKGELEGKFLFDNIALFHPEEKDGMRKRRHFVASRLGLIQSGAGDQTMKADAWMPANVVNRRVILTYDDNTYEDKNGKQVTRRQVPFFDGYERVEGETAPAETYDDI